MAQIGPGNIGHMHGFARMKMKPHRRQFRLLDKSEKQSAAEKFVALGKATN